MIQLCYFASLREILGVGKETVSLQAGIETIADLTKWLQLRGDTWDAALSTHNLHVALNHKIVPHDTEINDGDEIAWFPPVTGG